MQIVLLVTKAVGDFLGVSGIADEMIRFNGYPYLEKEDHAFHISGTIAAILIHFTAVFIAAHQLVSDVMRRDLQTLPASGLCVKDVGQSIINASFIRS